MEAQKKEFDIATGKLKGKLFRYGFLSFIFLVAALVIHFFVATSNSDAKTGEKRTGDVIRQKETGLKKIQERILSIPKDSLSFSIIHRIVPSSLWDQEGIILFVYKDDSLLYWSDNSVPVMKKDMAEGLNRHIVRFGNGWYDVVQSKSDNIKVIGLALVRYDYPYQNEYLRNEYHEDFDLGSEVKLDTIPGQVNIKDSNGDFLFSLDFPEHLDSPERYEFLFFFLLSASFVFFLILLFYIYHLFDFFRRRPLLMLAAFFVDTVLLRTVILLVKFPGFLYRTDLFSPYYYATSYISPSLGDLAMNSLMWLTLAWLFYYRTNLNWNIKGKVITNLTGCIALFFSGALYYLLMSTVRRMIVDSSFDLNLNNIFNIDVYSSLAFLALAALFMAFFLVTAKITRILQNIGLKTGPFILIAVVASLLVMPLFSRNNSTGLTLLFSLLLAAYLISLLYFNKLPKGYTNITGALYFIFFFSMINTFVLDHFQEEKEMNKRMILASELSSKRDPMMEFEYTRVKSVILEDTAIKSLISQRDRNKELDEKIMDHLKQKYFNSLWGNYEQLITICGGDEILDIQPAGYLVNCFDYFDGILENNKADTVADGLYFFNNRSENNNYIAVFEFQDPAGKSIHPVRIFAELYYKYIKETGLGYPDLLIDKKVKMISGLANYSYARYYNGSLVYKYGDFSYRLAELPYFPVDSTSYFIEKEGFNHYVTRADKDNVLIISKKSPGILDLIAPFSYLFIFFSLFLLLFLVLAMFPRQFRRLEFNFSSQLQLSIILIIVISFIILGFITRSRIIHLNNDKNTDILSEKTFSVLTELEHKIGNEPVVTPEMAGYLKDLLYKFSTIFYSDINLYDPEGNLIVSSRPQIFDEGLLSAKMNTEAFQRLAFEQNLLYLQNEKIGRQEYLSAYIPFRNNNDKVTAYLNLPYFAKQTEIRKEISDFLIAYINVYVLLIVLAIVVTIIVSRLVTRPLQLIRDKLGHIGLDKANEKIKWDRKDEIGSLIDEYNRMVDELARSAELLASSERESAWREMAKQVAHEIKNPLTPMKLSVQYLKKAWDEKAPDWENRLERFTKTIIEQIDNLSGIASAFSNFAKMPQANIEKIELTEIIKDSVNLYKDFGNIQFTEKYPASSYIVYADKRQLLSVFNNLIQNAVQAIGDKKDGIIGIEIAESEQVFMVAISDNGIGITKEQASRMFTPSFTTKSSGMGLGLAMVKSILTSMGGTITFTSKEGEGTVFTLGIPKHSAD
jgi:two-component system, NtrC family, nitrogen regulation sensor histidine kinase NtrY